MMSPSDRKNPRRRPLVDRGRLLGLLDPIEADDRFTIAAEQFEKLSVTDTLLMLADTTHEKEYTLCRGVTERLLGHCPDPEAVDDDLT